MGSAKPNAYLTEEARLEAQRRMLAERYGLLSDDSDDQDDNASDSNRNRRANGLPTQNGDTHPNHNAPNGNDSHAQPSPSPPDDPAPSEAATYGEGSSVHDSDLTFVMSQDENYANDPPPQPPEHKPPSHPLASDRAAGWPGVEVVDSKHGNKISANYVYKNSAQKDAVSGRDLRVTQITVYASQFLERHERKIAVNDHIIAYAVGGHIRAILRSSTVRSLLKGHDSSVADIEFLSTKENRIDSSVGENTSILGSVADDGSVYVWKIIRGDGDQATLNVADAIRFEHLDYDKGRSYRRIAFRPGPNSIIAENGIGVAMLLLDGESSDLRVVELVKMNDKMMVRDKFLKGRNEIVENGEKAEGNIDAATWLSERVVATSRGGHVFLWNADSNFSGCIARIPRSQPTRVTGLHAFNSDTLLCVVEAGRELELWHVAHMAPDMSSTSLQLRQKIQLFGPESSDIFCVTAVDRAEELVMLSNVKGNTFFALHYNAIAQAFDTITEVPVKHPILSFCMTRNEKKQSPVASVTSTSSMVNAEPAEELGIWCVQPRGIQLIHLPSKDCSPKSAIQSEVYPKPVTKTFTRKIEKIPPTLIAQTMPAGSGTAAKTKGTSSSSAPHMHSVSKRIPRSLGSIKALPPVQPAQHSHGESASTAVKNAVSNASANAERRDIATPNNDPKAQTSSSSTSSSGGGHTNSKPAPSPTTAASPSQVKPNADELGDSILDAAKKAIASFEEGAGQRSANEKAKMERLIESVTETVESNLERFVNSSMKKVLAETLVPGVSQIVADSRSALKESALSPKVTSEHFENVLDRSNICKSFSNACTEMTRQVSGAVTQSMTSKYDSLIKPTIDVVNDAAEDLSVSVTLLRKEVSKFRPSSPGGRPDIVEIEPEDIRRSIEEQISVGNVDGAFLTALDKGDLSLVTWLCGKFDGSSFFETHTISQVALISLAQQLGQGLVDGDVEWKVDWLRELMLVLEPDSDEIATISSAAVKELVENVNELRRNKAVLDQYDGLEKKLKTLGRLVSSHVPN